MLTLKGEGMLWLDLIVWIYPLKSLALPIKKTVGLLTNLQFKSNTEEPKLGKRFPDFFFFFFFFYICKLIKQKISEAPILM
jgi:hypothetical protein